MPQVRLHTCRTSSICAFSLNLRRSTACQRCNTAHQQGVPQPRGSRTRINPWQSINFPSGALTAGIIATQWSKGRTGTSGSGSLTGAATDAVRGRLHERVPGAITGFMFRATPCRRAAQGRIKQDKQCNGTDTNPHAANQHGCNYHKAPLPLGQPPPAVPPAWSDCDSIHRRHSVPIHDLSEELPLTTVQLSAPPFRCCSTQRRV